MTVFALWSAPRARSTAFFRSVAERGDVTVLHELYPAFWGRGLATEGARALIRSAFECLHLDRVVATTMADNIGSWRVLEKCGMRRVRTFYYPDADLMPGAEHGDYVWLVIEARDDMQVRVEPSLIVPAERVTIGSEPLV